MDHLQPPQQDRPEQQEQEAAADEDEEEGENEEETANEQPEKHNPPRTPLPSRIAPSSLPLGLARADFHALSRSPASPSACCSGLRRRRGTHPITTPDGETWTAEDDRMLVELVLEKLRLSKQDWTDCARSLGKRDRASAVGRRWKSLVLGGDVGLLRSRGAAAGRGRAKICGTWR